MVDSKQSEEALRKTWEHIDLVIKYLMSVQIELMMRIATHDRSKLAEPEWKMFENVTHKLEGLTYGSEEYEKQRGLMLDEALGHHYQHNRHHPEYFDFYPENNEIEYMLEKLENHDDLEKVYDVIEKISYEYQAQVNNMNLIDLIEMVCDWISATKKHADGDIHESIRINTERFNLSPQVVNIIRNTVNYLDNEFKGLTTQKDL